jgi:hypothetical protein
VAGDCLASSNMPDVLAGLGLDVDGRFSHAEQPGEVGPDGLLVRSELRLLRMNDDVAIDGPPSCLFDPLDNFRQQPCTFEATPLRIGIRVMLPDIAESGRPQKRISHRVANYVRVGVPKQPRRVLDPQPTQDQRSSLA